MKNREQKTENMRHTTYNMQHATCNMQHATRSPQQRMGSGWVRASRFTNRGFTFVETLVAIAILLLGVVAPLALTYQSLAASRIARNQITATFLAEEAIEYVRAIRDTNTLEGSSWLSGLDDCLTAGGCAIDETGLDEVSVCDPDAGCSPLLYNSETAVYGYEDENATTSPFTRTTKITETVPGEEANVAVEVKWPDGATERKVIIDESIFNWQ